MSILKFATFNVENLFSRAKVLNYYNPEVGDEKMKTIADLRNEFKKATYDKPKIIDLYKEVKDLIKFNVIKSKVGQYIIYESKDKYQVAPNGIDDWFGYIEFKRDKFDDVSMKNAARVIKEINADVICLIEVENRPTLESFNSQQLEGLYPYNMLIDGNDDRGIDVSICSMLKLNTIRTNIFDGPPKSRTFSRDCLEVEVIAENGKSIYFMINHLKSKLGADQAANDARRKLQADRINEILQERYNLDDQLIVIAGDFNDTPNSTPLQPLLGNVKLFDVLKEKFPEQPEERWTYHYKKKKQQFDYILASKPLMVGFRDAGVLLKGIAEVEELSNGQIEPYKDVTSWRDAASDHGAVWAEFEL